MHESTFGEDQVAVAVRASYEAGREADRCPRRRQRTCDSAVRTKARGNVSIATLQTLHFSSNQSWTVLVSNTAQAHLNQATASQEQQLPNRHLQRRRVRLIDAQDLPLASFCACSHCQLGTESPAPELLGLTDHAMHFDVVKDYTCVAKDEQAATGLVAVGKQHSTVSAGECDSSANVHSSAQVLAHSSAWANALFCPWEIALEDVNESGHAAGTEHMYWLGFAAFVAHT